MAVIYARKGKSMAITHEGEFPPQEPENEKFINPLDSSSAPTQEEAAERNAVVPEPDTSLNSTTVISETQAPDMVYAKTAETPQKRSKVGIAVGAALFAAGLAAGALIGLDSEDRNTNPVSATETSDEETGISETTLPASDETNNVPSAEDIVSNDIGPRILKLNEVKPGDDFVTAVRPNGESIRVPKLRDSDNPYEVMESALALYACAVSTLDQNCIDAFTDDPDVAASLERIYATDTLPQISSGEYAELNKDGQIAIISDPADPAVFEWQEGDAGRRWIELVGGSLYYNQWVDFTGSNEWQGENVRESGAAQNIYTNLRFYFRENADGEPRVTGIDFDHTPVTE